jgi:hypothetical protein
LRLEWWRLQRSRRCDCIGRPARAGRRGLHPACRGDRLEQERLHDRDLGRVGSRGRRRADDDDDADDDDYADDDDGGDDDCDDHDADDDDGDDDHSDDDHDDDSVVFGGSAGVVCR